MALWLCPGLRQQVTCGPMVAQETQLLLKELLVCNEVQHSRYLIIVGMLVRLLLFPPLALLMLMCWCSLHSTSTVCCMHLHCWRWLLLTTVCGC